MENFELKIQKISGPRKCVLRLEGTVMLLWEKVGKLERQVMMPVELVSVYFRRRVMGSRVITALLIPVLMLIMVTLGDFIFGKKSPESYETVAVLLFIASLLTLPVTLYFAFKKQQTVYLCIAPENLPIEFWAPKAQTDEINSFLESLEQRQKIVESQDVLPAKKAIEFTGASSMILQLLYWVWIFALPAFVLEMPVMFVLCIAPVLWFGFKQMVFYRQPRSYRQAIKSVVKRDWDRALEHLRFLKGELPEYIPGLLLFIQVYIRQGKFDEALEVANQLPDEQVDLARAVESDIIGFMKLSKRRQSNSNTAGNT